MWLAVVSQPSDRAAQIKLPGKVDQELGEFWVENPWDITTQGHNLSAYERNRLYLNVPDRDGRNFIEVSYLSGADSDGDGRSAVAGDFRNTGQLDLAVRQAGGGSFLLYENHLPKKHYLEVTLRGTKSNRRGIGARVLATVNGQPIVREQFPHNSFHSQMPGTVHLGLGDVTKVDQLRIQWPSGLVQELKAVPGDRHIVVEEGNDSFETVVPGQAVKP